MNIEQLKEKKKLISIVLLGCSVIFAASIMAKLANCFTVSARAESLSRAAIAQNSTDENDMENFLKPSRDLADKLKRNNYFTPSEPDEHPIKEVRAIFGDEVLIESKWYEVGQMVGEAKIVSIEPSKVKIEWKGRQRDFLPIDASIPESARSERDVARGDSSGQDRADMVIIGSDSVPNQDMGGRRQFGPGAFQSGEGRGPMGGFQGGMRQRFQMMSEAERQALRDEMRERFGRGGGGFDRGGGFDSGGGEFFNRGGRQGRGRGGGRGGQ